MSPMLMLVALLGAASPAPAAATPSNQDADAAAYAGQKNGTTYYDFGDDDIQGEVLSPTGTNIQVRTGAHHASLLDVRANFIPELDRDTYDL